ncbi:unnamed protein product [Lampetra fluviatilis]
MATCAPIQDDDFSTFVFSCFAAERGDSCQASSGRSARRVYELNSALQQRIIIVVLPATRFSPRCATATREIRATEVPLSASVTANSARALVDRFACNGTRQEGHHHDTEAELLRCNACRTRTTPPDTAAVAAVATVRQRATSGHVCLLRYFAGAHAAVVELELEKGGAFGRRQYLNSTCGRSDVTTRGGWHARDALRVHALQARIEAARCSVADLDA